MVLTDLGRRLNGALHSLTATKNVDDAALDGVLKEICVALLEADVNVRLVQTLRKNIKENPQINDPAAGFNKKKLIQRAILDELRKLVDPKVAPFQPKRNHPNVILFVGLQGSGKTTTCTKASVFYSVLLLVLVQMLTRDMCRHSLDRTVLSEKRLENRSSLCGYVPSWCI